MNTQKAVYITHAKRTAIGTFQGHLRSIAAPLLSATIIRNILNETRLPNDAINEVILSQVIVGGEGQNPARQALIQAGIPEAVPAYTVNKVCGSGLKTVALAASSIIAGENELVLAGGQENMSQGRHAAYIRQGQKYGEIKMIDLMQHDGLTDVFSCNLMGVTAENVAKQFNISREMQDEFALKSQQKAAEAARSGRFKDEIVQVEASDQKSMTIFDQDEGIRPDSTLEKLARLKPVFDKNGSVTAGNSSGINDGAAVLMVASEDALRKYNLTPLVRIVSYASAGVDPNIMGTGPVPASKRALAKAGWQVQDLDIIEANEAFAASSIYVNQQMGWDPERVNVNGGAIALGHPIGASGGRIVVTLIHQMRRQKATKALATLCIGGGMGIAMCVEGV